MNTCSDVTTPCRTFTGAVGQVDPGGEVIVLNSGSYGGTSITKSVKINVPNGVVAFAASPFTIDAAASDVVVLRGLTLKAFTPGVGIGILFNTAASLHVERCVLDGWNVGVDFAAAGKLYLNDTVVRNASGAGVIVSASVGTAAASIERVRLEGNGAPNNECGLAVRDGGRASLRDSEASGNVFGLCAQVLSGGMASLNVQDALVANNAQDGIACLNGAGATARASSAIVTENGTGLRQASGCLFESLGNNLVRGNLTNTVGTITIIAGQ
jgi:hypothetical protein